MIEAFRLNIDELIKSQGFPFGVIPSKAGIQCFQILMAGLDPGCSLSRTMCGAWVTTSYESINIVYFIKMFKSK